MVDVTLGRGPRKLWRIVLVLSLALNLAIVGIVAGAAVSGRLGKGPPRAFDMGLGPVARALDPAARRAIGAALRDDRDLRGLDMRAQFAAMMIALRRDPFDRDALQDVMIRQSERMMALQGKARDALIDQIDRMTPEERARFADRLENELRRPRRLRESRSGG